MFYLTIAWRYFRAKKSTQAINVIAWISVGAITVGTCSLIIILSAFNGFESLVKSLYSSFYPDVRIEPKTGKIIRLTQDDLEKIRKVSGLYAFSLVAEERALLQNGPMQTVVQLKGVDEQYRMVSGLSERMVRGRFELGNDEIPHLVMGVGIENAIGVLSDRMLTPLTLYMPKRGQSLNADPMQSLSVASIVSSGSFAIQQEFDNAYIFTNLDFVRLHLQMKPDEYSAVELSLSPGADPVLAIGQLKAILGERAHVLDRYAQNKTLYATISMEKWVIYGIFTLILLVAAFNMVGALTMLVLEKQRDIQVFQALGADARMVRRIFLTEGILLAGLGALIGMLLALLLYYLQVTYKLVPLQGQSFLIDYYPVKLNPTDFLLVMSTVLLIGILASWLPAERASRQPFTLR